MACCLKYQFTYKPLLGCCVAEGHSDKPYVWKKVSSGLKLKFRFFSF